MWEMVGKVGRKTKCQVCGMERDHISSTLGVCVSCIRNNPDKALLITNEVHRTIREEFLLPREPPQDPGGIRCTICANECTIGEGNKGYCGLRNNVHGTLEVKEGVLFTYYDPQPSNCCAAWFCAGSKVRGYNLAVFPFGCSFDCVFCQNWEHKKLDIGHLVSPDALVKAAEKASCVCYFGGTPEPQLPFLLGATRQILQQKQVRICWEWNGTGNPALVRQAAEYASLTGGTVKFDLKALDGNLHRALTGRPNHRTLENFQMVAEEFPKKDLLTATTLLVPGYVESDEVEQIARFIASVNPDIPYSLLAFHPDFQMRDLPVTTRKSAEKCYTVAKQYMKRVYIGNQHLLW